ncbi:hypothetical protein H1224_18165 [Pectobacterium aroidearum]|uniref:hypothetical protein n=2 Tax=Pectobacterium TaxID=122277 RepID=UPI0015F7354F|nr:hypothetical protein [Pectobacterium aroidearum]MBA5602976.1 hypothetical protein [Pectobacterium aroidearum]
MRRDVIPFEYATIARAARFFGCEVEDIFHWNEIGLIKLSLSFDDLNGTLLSINNESFEFAPEFSGSAVDEVELDYRDSISSFVCEHLLLDSVARICRVHGVATGLWVPNPATIEHLKNHGNFLSSFSASPYGADTDYRVMVEIKKVKSSAIDIIHTNDGDNYYPEITAENLTLYKDDLIIIKRLLADGVSNSTGQSEEATNSGQKEHATQFIVICQLLKMIGLSDDEIYTNPPAQLQRILEQKASKLKISFPGIDKNTWGRWRGKFPSK